MPNGQSHHITPFNMQRGAMLALCGMNPNPEGGFRPLPTESSLVLPASANAITANEPALRLCRPVIDWCVTEAIKQDVHIQWLALGVGEYEALPPDLIYHQIVSQDRCHEHYTRNARGDKDLLDVHADWLRMMTGYDYRSGGMMLTAGCLDAARNCILYLTDPGDEITFVEPHWINSYTMAVAYGRRVSKVTLDWRNNYAKPQTWQEWEELVPKTATVLWLEGQGNPTGFGWNNIQEMEALAEFTERRVRVNPQFITVVDEEYRLLYESLKPLTILSLAAPHIVTISSWDKTFCATSLRLGSIESADPKIISLLQPLANLHLSAPNFMGAQAAVAEVMRNRTQKGGLAYLCGLAHEIKSNRDTADRVLANAVGRNVRGKAAFYNTWVIEELGKGETVQAILHTLFIIANALRQRKDPGISVYTDAVPLTGFYHGGQGPGGFRLTLGRSEAMGLTTALEGLKAVPSRFLEAGRPNYGPAKQAVAKFMSGEVVSSQSFGA